MSKMVERMQVIVGKQDFASSIVNTLDATNATRDYRRTWSDMTWFKIDPEAHAEAQGHQLQSLAFRECEH